MSRRKQAKPRAVKRDLEDEDEAGGVSMATEAGRDAACKSLGSDCGPSTPTSRSSDPGLSLTSVDPDRDLTLTSDVTMEEEEAAEEEEEEDLEEGVEEEEEYRCETCNGLFHSLLEFMDHRNYECTAGEMAQGDNRSSSRGSCSSSPFSVATGSPGSSLLTPDLLPSSSGVDADHPFACNYCNKAFAKTSHLKRHEQVHSDVLPHKCDLCHRVFKHKRSRDRHQRMHLINNKYTCPQCGAKFKRLELLKTHMKTHKEAEDQGHQCPVCHVTFTSAAALTSHMWTHKNGTTSEEKSLKRKAEKSKTLHDLLVQGLPDDFHSMTKARAIQCPYCAEICLGKQSLEFHFEHSHPGEKFKCPVCNAGYVQSEDLFNHLRTQHDYPPESDTPPVLGSPHSKNSENNFVMASYSKHDCPFCDKGGFSSSDVLEIHVRTLHADKLSQLNICNYCNAVYQSVSDLEEHIKLHHVSSGSLLNVKFNCDACPLEFSTFEGLQLHKDSVHAYKSDLYSKSDLMYVSKADNHFSGELFVKADSSLSKSDSINCKSVMHCSVCNLGFSSLGMLSEHIMNSHGINLSTKSPSPGVSSAGSAGGKRGADIAPRQSPVVPHTPKINRPPSNASSCGGIGDVSSWSCDHCNAAFPDIRTFQTHMKMHAEANQPGRYPCNHCSARFPSEELLENHVFIHYLSQTTEYGCTSCMKLFAKPDELQKHLMDIHAHHLYRCALCKEVFDSKVNVQVHFAIKHSNECQLFKCTNCGSVFRSEMEWQLHVKVQHLGISKPYRCLFCKESFSSEVDLQCHLTSHKKPFACPLCDEAFHVEYLLDKHIQTQHNPETDKNMKASPRTFKEEQPEALDFSYSSSEKMSQQVSPVSSSHTEGAIVMMTSSPGASRISCSPTLLKKSDLIHKCDICDVKFSDEIALQKHRIHDHSISPEMSLIMQKAQPHISPSTPNLTTPDKFSQLCVYCNQTFKSKSELEKHMKSHVTPSSQKCNICDEVFPSPTILAEHKLQHCKIIKGNVCVVCKVAMKNEEQFYNHAQQHGYQGTSMQCIICRQTLSSMLELQMHGKHHFQGSTSYHTCCVCLKSFSSKENLIAKLNTSGRSYYVCKPCYHGEGAQEYRCSTCGVKFETQAQLDAHSLQHKKTYQCIKCQQSFSTEYEIQVHVATHVMQEGNIHECKMCNSHFDSPAKLQAHLIEHTYENSSDMRCLICQALFTHVSAIQMHVLEHGLAARQYSCTQCHQKFFFSAELQNHLLSHIPTPVSRSSQDLRCPDCKKTFTSIITLNTHRRCHDKDSTSSRCSICALTFSNMAQLQQHFFAVHTSEPGEHLTPESAVDGATSHDKVKRSPRAETTMEKSSNHRNNNTGKENRKGQAKAHHTPKPVPCMICGKTFAKKALVKEHMKIHFAQANIFQCDHCNETFNQASLLQRHLESSHNKTEMTSLTCMVTCQVCSEEMPASALTSHIVQAHGITKTEPIDHKITGMDISDTSLSDKNETFNCTALQNGNSHEMETDFSNDNDCKTSLSGSPSPKFTNLNGSIDGVTVLSNPSEQVSVS